MRFLINNHQYCQEQIRGNTQYPLSYVLQLYQTAVTGSHMNQWKAHYHLEEDNVTIMFQKVKRRLVF